VVNRILIILLIKIIADIFTNYLAYVWCDMKVDDN